MRIAVACTGMDVAAHLSAADNFTVYTTASFAPVSVQSLPLAGSTAEELAQELRAVKADVLLLGARLDGFAAQSFTSRGIAVSRTREASAREAADAYLAQRGREMDMEFSKPNAD